MFKGIKIGIQSIFKIEIEQNPVNQKQVDALYLPAMYAFCLYRTGTRSHTFGWEIL